MQKLENDQNLLKFIQPQSNEGFPDGIISTFCAHRSSLRHFAATNTTQKHNVNSKQNTIYEKLY